MISLILAFLGGVVSAMIKRWLGDEILQYIVRPGVARAKDFVFGTERKTGILQHWREAHGGPVEGCSAGRCSGLFA